MRNKPKSLEEIAGQMEAWFERNEDAVVAVRMLLVLLVVAALVGRV